MYINPLTKKAFLGAMLSIPSIMNGMEAIEHHRVEEKPKQLRDPEEFFNKTLSVDIWRKILDNLDMYDTGWRFVHRYVPLSPDRALTIAQDIDASFSLVAHRLPVWLKAMEDFLKNGYWSATYEDKKLAMSYFAEQQKRREDYMKREYASSPYRPDSFFVDPSLPTKAVTSEAVSKAYSAGYVQNKEMLLQRLKPLFIPLNRRDGKNDSYKQIRACLEGKMREAKKIIDDIKTKFVSWPGAREQKSKAVGLYFNDLLSTLFLANHFDPKIVRVLQDDLFNGQGKESIYDRAGLARFNHSMKIDDFMGSETWKLTNELDKSEHNTIEIKKMYYCVLKLLCFFETYRGLLGEPISTYYACNGSKIVCSVYLTTFLLLPIVLLIYESFFDTGLLFKSLCGLDVLAISFGFANLLYIAMVNVCFGKGLDRKTVFLAHKKEVLNEFIRRAGRDASLCLSFLMIKFFSLLQGEESYRNELEWQSNIDKVHCYQESACIALIGAIASRMQEQRGVSQDAQPGKLLRILENHA